ncbi:unnamed protein product [Prunus armeniaca]
MTDGWGVTWRERRGGPCMEGKCVKSLKDRADMRDALKVIASTKLTSLVSFVIVEVEAHYFTVKLHATSL